MSDDEKPSMLDQMRGSQSVENEVKPDISDDTLEVDRREFYNVIKDNLGKEHRNIVFRWRDGRKKILYYHYISEIDYASSKLFSFIYHSGIYTIRGSDLEPLLNCMKNQTAHLIFEIDHETQQVDDRESTVVESITFTLPQKS